MTVIRQSYGDVAGAFGQAPHRATVSMKQHRGGAHSIEGRGAVAAYDLNEDRLTLWNSTQLAHEVRAFLMNLLMLDENQVRVVAPDVGGGFGAKFVMYPEEVALAAACLKLKRPVKWIEDRREHFLAAVQERDQYWDLEVAFESDGRLRGVRGRMIHDEGAYTPQGINLPYNASTALPGPYLLPAYEITVQVVETNKVATMPVRGAGYPEGAFAMERVLDRIAGELGLDRAEVRRRNLVPVEKIPYTTPLKSRSGSAITLDSGDFPRCLQMALDAIGYQEFAARQSRARAEGRYLGIGVGNGVKGTGRGPFESGIVRIGRSGRISVYTGAMPMGQGIKTALAQICAEQFNVAARQRHRDGRRHRGDPARPGRLRQPPDHHRRLGGPPGRGRGPREGARGRGASARSKPAGPGDEGRPHRRRRRSGLGHHAEGGRRGGVRRAGLSDARPFRARASKACRTSSRRR